MVSRVFTRPLTRLCGVLAVATLVGATGLAAPAQAHRPGDRPGSHAARKLARSVTLPAMLKHLKVFQAIADASDGNRASGSPGHDRSADYVAWKLRKAGYRVTRQPFEFNFCDERGSSFERTTPDPVTFLDGTDYDLMSCSGAGDVTAEVVPVDLDLTDPREPVSSGCEASDFEGLDLVGRIALLQRGSPPGTTCTFGQKVTNAQAAGAAGAIVMNQGNGDPVTNPDRYSLVLGTLGNPVGIPAIGVSYALGETLATTPGTTVRITADTVSEVRQTVNVIAESRRGRADEVVMAGAHLDSEPDTAGINDNGSGSAALLEVAIKAAKLKHRNKLRFAWWGAEESNLVGSTFYVGGLTGEQIADIALYLNFDMIGSANYMFGVYDGDDSAASGSGPGPVGSAEIEDVFEAFFARRGQSTEPADFNGRSDYGPFINPAVGIPAGGLFTGAEGRKTEEQVARYGGVAGEQFDPCYHDPCDSLRPVTDGADPDLYAELRRQYRLFGNVNLFAFDTNADAMATAVATFAYDTSALPPRPAPAAAATARAATAGGATADGATADGATAGGTAAGGTAAGGAAAY